MLISSHTQWINELLTSCTVICSCIKRHRLSSGSFDKLWHCSAVRFTVYTQWKWRGQHQHDYTKSYISQGLGRGEYPQQQNMLCAKADGIMQRLFCFTHARVNINFPLCFVSAGGIWCRRHTWTSHWVKNVSQHHSKEVRLGENARCFRIWPALSLCCSFFRCFCRLFSQFLDSSGWFAVLSSRFAAELLSDDSTPPGPEHHGISAMALGPQQCHDDQSGPRHKEQSLYTRFAGPYKWQIHKYIHMAWKYNIYLYLFILNHFSSIPTCPSLGCLTPTWWWATITSSRMMTRQKWKALLSKISSYPV